MASISQKVFDEVGYNLSEETKRLIKSLDSGPRDIPQGDASKEVKRLLDDNERLVSENKNLRDTVASLQETLSEKHEGEADITALQDENEHLRDENRKLKEKVEGLEHTIGLLKDREPDPGYENEVDE